jgi:hypothetical protein
MPQVAYTAHAHFASGSQSATVDISRLNLDSIGAPLTFRTAIRGKDKDKWAATEIKELMRLSSSQTLFPTHISDVPPGRRGDITYYNPKPKEKQLDAAGNKTCRIRGTAGGDTINNPGYVSARVADLDAVKIHLHSIISDGA